MKILLTYLVCASMHHFLVDALRCNNCFYDTSLNSTACSATIENCISSYEFCATIWQERDDGTKIFTRQCVPDEVCKQEYCENMVQNYGRKSCNVTQCCQEDLCNRDGYTVKVCRNFTHINTGVGNIHSPEFPSRDYPNNVDCMWKITTPPNTRINLKVISMSIQSCDACKCDFLEIRDGNSSSDLLLGKFCGSKLPGDLYSSGRHLWVRFKSDSENVESGFAAMFKSSVIKENSCPAIWKYPFRCPKELTINADKSTDVCCYDNGPDCCDSGGRRCTDKGSSKRDYCPRPGDDKKLKYCCITEEEEPSCCASSGVCHKFRFILLVGVILHIFLACAANGTVERTFNKIET